MNKEELKEKIIEKLQQNKKEVEDLTWMIESMERTKKMNEKLKDYLKDCGEL